MASGTPAARAHRPVAAPPRPRRPEKRPRASAIVGAVGLLAALGASGVATPTAAIGAIGLPAPAVPVAAPSAAQAAAASGDLRSGPFRSAARSRDVAGALTGPSLVPTRAQFAAAVRYARTRRGAVAIATIDASRRLRAFRGTRAYLSASVVKAMLLVAYLDRPQQRGRPLPATARRRLSAMIRRSGNAAATWAYRIVGPEGLWRVARRARMRRFAPARAWGNSRITAIDQARFFLRIDRLVPERHRAFTRALLSGIVPSQRWGIPAAAPAQYAIFFKGGWRRAGGRRRTDDWVVHQVARLEHAGSALSIAILTRGNPSMRYGTQTIRGVAARLLR